MRATITILLATVLAGKANAQEPTHTQSEYRYAVKLYNTVSRQEYPAISLNPNLTLGRTETKFLSPSVAFTWKTKKGNYREIELSSLQLGKERQDMWTNSSGLVESVIINNSDIKARYEHILVFAKSKAWKLKPMLGIGAEPFFQYQRISYISTAVVARPFTTQTFGARLYASPRINWDLSQRLLLDVNIPICVAEINSQSRSDFDNFGVTRKTSVFNFEAAPVRFSARVGLGLRL
jgi:hypothetical protein